MGSIGTYSLGRRQIILSLSWIAGILPHVRNVVSLCVSTRFLVTISMSFAARRALFWNLNNVLAEIHNILIN